MGAWVTRAGYLAIIMIALVVSTGVWAEQGTAVPATADLEREADIPVPEQASWAEREQGNVERSADRVQRMLDKARQASPPDLIKVNCLDDKLTQLNKNAESFRGRREQHKAAVDDARRDHFFRLMVILAERGRSLRNEAEACIGGSDISFGQTTVETEIDPSITEDDATQWATDQGEFLPPPSATGYYK